MLKLQNVSVKKDSLIDEFNCFDVCITELRVGRG